MADEEHPQLLAGHPPAGKLKNVKEFVCGGVGGGSKS